MTQPSLSFDAPQTVYAAHRADVRAEVAQEGVRRTSLMWRVLAALEQAGEAGVTNVDLVRIGGMNAAGRVSDLRRHHKCRIVAERITGGLFRYTLIGGAHE
jgi:hypothetical protein